MEKVMKFNDELKCSTVGELKEILKYVPDEWVLVTTDDDANCIHITFVNSFWHGALTFEHE